MINKKKTRGLAAQSILEYAVMVAIAIAALVAMQIYVKRGIEGGLKESADSLGEQYQPGFMDTRMTTQVTSTQTVDSNMVQLADNAGTLLFTGMPIAVDASGNPTVFQPTVAMTAINSVITMDDVVSRQGTEAIGNFEDDLF